MAACLEDALLVEYLHHASNAFPHVAALATHALYVGLIVDDGLQLFLPVVVHTLAQRHSAHIGGPGVDVHGVGEH